MKLQETINTHIAFWEHLIKMADKESFSYGIVGNELVIRSSDANEEFDLIDPEFPGLITTFLAENALFKWQSDEEEDDSEHDECDCSLSDSPILKRMGNVFSGRSKFDDDGEDDEFEEESTAQKAMQAILHFTSLMHDYMKSGNVTQIEKVGKLIRQRWLKT